MKSKLRRIIKKFPAQRIAVVGDLMLDVYISGKASRISPEAPVPVVQVQQKRRCLGGAANVMRNITTLGGKVLAFGVTGADANGEKLRELLAQYNIDDIGVHADPSRKTTEKQRVIAGSQQLLRIDFEDTAEVESAIRRKICDELCSCIKSRAVDAIIFEDYGKGLLNSQMVQLLADEAKKTGIISALDPKPGHLESINNLTVMKPNRNEAFNMAGRVRTERVEPAEQDEKLHEVAQILMQRWQPQQLLISLSSQGMALFQPHEDLKIIPTRAREVFDVSGAGDTVIATYTLSLAAGAGPEEAAEIANHAAGIVVGKVGTVTVGVEELIGDIENER